MFQKQIHNKRFYAKSHVLNKYFLLVIFAGFFISLHGKADKTIQPDFLEWPKVTHPETRPWTWWWWHGCAANKQDISNMLDQFHQIGLGGVNIVCVNDVIDPLKPHVDFLSPEYIDLMRFSMRKVRSMGMNADISPVGGWSFGGKYIPLDKSCMAVNVQKISIDSIFKAHGNNIFYKFAKESPVNFKHLESVLFVSKDGHTRTIITDKVDSSGVLHMDLSNMMSGDIFLTCHIPGVASVRAATPDWKGYVVNHLKKEDVKYYFSAFDKAFANIPSSELPRAYNNDSWEIFLDWTDSFFDEFKKRRGYDLQNYMPEFIGYGNPATVKRVVCDYRETLSNLMFDEFTLTFKDWANSHGGKIIGEVQFEPANELDINSLYDIPQADMGGWLDWYIQQDNYVLDQLFMRCKMPASPAHLLGKPYISSETYTCMGGLEMSLNDVKTKTDVDLIAGVNHTAYHGITYTPASAHWPGWLFYAGTQLGPFNPQWRNMPLLSKYITRNQSFLQSGRSDNQILFYFPMYDEWSMTSAAKGNAPGKADISTMRFATSDMPTTHQLWNSGLDFDFISDYLLQKYIRVEDHKFVSPANEYKAIVISNCKYLPLSTLQLLMNDVKLGGTVIFAGNLPDSVPGLDDLANRQSDFQNIMQQILRSRKPVNAEVMAADFGPGHFIFGNDVNKCCLAANIFREKLFDKGLYCVKRQDEQGSIYFVVNPDCRHHAVNAWIPFSAKGQSAAIYDAMTGRTGMAAFRNQGDSSYVYLQLEPNQSCIVRIFNNVVRGDSWNYTQTASLSADGFPVSGLWNVSFIAGGEKLPHPETVSKLSSWTTWDSDQKETLDGFSGTAKYQITFDKPNVAADHFILDLGNVCFTAKVSLNGKFQGECISTPMKILLDNQLKAKGNLLSIEVTNTAVNRSGSLEKRGIKWMYDVPGSYDIQYYIDAKTWQPQQSGLLGPVTLIPVFYFKP